MVTSTVFQTTEFVTTLGLPSGFVVSSCGSVRPARPRAGLASQASRATPPNPVPTSSPKDRMPPQSSFWVGLTFQLLLVLNMTSILPTAPSYAEKLGAGASFSGVMVAALPATALLIIYPLQKIMERFPLKSVFFVSTVGNVLACVIYACTGLTHSKYTLVLSRLLSGFCSSNAPMIVYISRTVGLNHRSRAMMMLTSIYGAGYALGPFLAFLIGVFCKDLRIDNLVVDQNTLPGWVLAFLFLAHLVFQHFLFVEQPVNEGSAANEDVLPQSVQEKELQDERPRFLPVVLLIFVQLAGAMAFAFWEVFAALHCTRSWVWSDEIAGLYMAIMMFGLLLVCVPFSCFVSGKLSDRWVLLWSCVGATIGTLLLFDYSLTRDGARVAFTVGSFVLLTGCQILRGSATALCSKVIPNNLQGRMTTWVAGTVNLGRTLGPLLGAHLGPSAFAATNLGVMFAIAIGTAFVFRHLMPHAKAT